MSRKKITHIKKEVVPFEVKQIRIQNDLTDFTKEDYQFTVNYCFSEFMVYQEEKGNSKATLDYYRRFYVKFCKFFESIKSDVKDTPITVLTKLKGLQLWFTKSLGDVDVQTQNNYLRAYRSFGNYCEEIGYVQGFKCTIKEVEPKIKQVYTDEDIAKLLVKPSIDNYTEYRNYVIINLMLSTGARSNTILNIKIDDVNLTENTIVFNTTKAHKTVCLPLERTFAKVLKEYLYNWQHCAKKGYLFFNDYGEQLTRDGLCKAIANYNKRRGVDKTSIHLFRHTFAKKWIQSGKDIFTLKRILTHSELAMVERYSNIYSTDLENAINENSILSQQRTRCGQTVRTQGRNRVSNNIPLALVG